MIFSIEKEKLLSLLNTVEKFVPNKTTIPILSGIKFSAKEKFLELSSTDLDMGIECKIEADIKDEGSAVIPSKTFLEIVRKLPKGELFFSKNEDKINIKAGEINLSLPCFEPYDFPEVLPEKSEHILNFSHDLFKKMVKQTIFATAEESLSRPVLTGELLEVKNGKFNIVALDGFRIAWRWEEIDADNFSVIVPGKTLSEFSKIDFDEDNKEFEIHIANNKIIFKSDSLTITSRLLEGKFIEYEEIVKVEPKVKVLINTDELLESVERAYVFAKEGSKNNIVKINIQDGVITVSSESEAGNFSENIKCETSGEDLIVAFNAKFLIDALKSVEYPEISMEFGGEVNPLIIKPVNVENHINFLLPVRLRSEA